MAAASNWYIIRAVPGSQRMARAIDGLPDYRKGESILERQCRDNGVEVYMPAFWETARHQRTNKLIERRYPIIVGYAFVNIAGEGFYKNVNKVESIQGFIKSGGVPIRFPAEDIGVLAAAEFERHGAYEKDRREREELYRKYRRNVLNKSLGLIFPKGRRKKIPLRMIAEEAIISLSPASRFRVQNILNELKALDDEEMACNSWRTHLESVA